MAEIKKVPAIRFKGFSDVWTESNFLDNIEKIIDFRGRTPKKLGLDWSESGYLALSALNVKSGYIDFKVDAHYGNQELYDKWMLGNELHKNQVLFTTEAPMGNVAQIPDEEKYILSQRTIAFEVKPSLLAEDFLAIVLGSPKTFKKLTSMSSGGTAKGVSQKSLATLGLTIPSDTTEQIQIGSYFQRLDKLISLHQAKINKLTNLKKAMLEKMFPKQGADVPEIRFKGFAGAWDERPIESIFNYERPDNYIVKSVEYSDEHSTPVLTANKAFILGYTNETRIFNEPSIIFDDFTLDFKYVDFPYMVKSSALKILTIKDVQRDNLIFALNLLNSTKFETMGHARHYISVVQPKNVRLPKIDEQEKIATYFQNLDKTITLHQTELEKLNNLKKACLEKMFV